MMSLRKEPERRYASVSQFADDLKRFLAGLPVLAAPDTFRYRTRKFIGLHKIGIAAVAAVILVLAGGLASTLYQMRRAEREKREAQQRFQQVRKLANTFLFDFNDSIADVAGTTQARALVVKTAQEYLNSLSASANSDPELQAELAHAYFRVADVQGAPRKSNLGDTAGAEANYRRAIAMYEPLVRKDPAHVLDLIDSWTALGVLQANTKQSAEAQASLAKAAALIPSVKDDGQLHTFSSIINVYRAGADAAYFGDDLALSIKTLREGLAFGTAWRKAHPDSGEPDVSFYLGTTHQRLGNALQSVPSLDEAEAEASQAIADIGRAHDIKPQSARFTRNLIVSELTLSDVYLSNGEAPDLERPDDAAIWGRKALELLAPQVQAEKIDVNSRELYLRGLLHVAYADLRSGKNNGVAVRKARSQCGTK
jgi:eukaryotic-like serine/threonine-protein kinase